MAGRRRRRLRRLAHACRLEILARLDQRAELSAGELANAIVVNPPYLSRQLTILNKRRQVAEMDDRANRRILRRSIRFRRLEWSNSKLSAQHLSCRRCRGRRVFAGSRTTKYSKAVTRRLFVCWKWPDDRGLQSRFEGNRTPAFHEALTPSAARPLAAMPPDMGREMFEFSKWTCGILCGPRVSSYDIGIQRRTSTLR